MGISRHEYLYELRFWEMMLISRGYERRKRDMWSAVRWQTFNLMWCSMADIKKAFALMPGTKRLNLHASYAILGDEQGKIDRDAYRPDHFTKWVEFAKEIGLAGIDFNPTCFSHPKVVDGLTLSAPDPEIRKFWIDHCIASIRIAEYFAKEMGTKSRLM